MRKKSLPLVSVVVTTKNEERNIVNCLKGVVSQNYPRDKIEIILVDNNSEDRTKEITQKYTERIYNYGPERSAQRNCGMKMAGGNYLVYLDADMILSPTVVEKSVEMLEGSDLVALYIPEVILGNSYWSRVRRFERSFYDGTVIDCVRFIKKDIFERIGGFDTTMTGPEDWDFDKKIRNIGKVEVLDNYDFKEVDNKLLKIDYQKSDFIDQLHQLSSHALVYHNEAKFNLKKYFQKKSYYAKSFNTYISKWGKNDQDIKKQFGFIYRYFKVFMENGKWEKMIKNPGLMVGTFLLRILLGFIYLLK